jgi:hypothetical protein
MELNEFSSSFGKFDFFFFTITLSLLEANLLCEMIWFSFVGFYD